MVQDLNDLYLFARVVEAGGFSSGERLTGIPKSRLSRRVAALEAQLGVRLVHRSTNRFQVTDVGERVYRHARSMADEAGAAAAAVSDALAEPSGLVRISASPLSAQLHLGPWLAEFMSLHPKVILSLDTSNRFVDLLRERIDLALRYSASPLASQDVVARPIAKGRLVLVASPRLIAALGMPTGVGDLSRYPALGLGGVGSVRAWTFKGEDGNHVTHHPDPRFASDSIPALREAAVRGVGVAQLPLPACADQLSDGSLVAVLPEHESVPTTLYAMYASRHGMTSALRGLIDFLEERFRAID